VNKLELAGNVLSEFAPIAVFVVVSELHGFQAALPPLVIVALCSVLLSWFIEKRIPKFGLLASGTILFFGMLSIITGNPFFIIIKDTLFYGTFGSVLLLGILLDKYVFELLFKDFQEGLEDHQHPLDLLFLSSGHRQ
jgi:intracellular septation protein A